MDIWRVFFGGNDGFGEEEIDMRRIFRPSFLDEITV